MNKKNKLLLNHNKIDFSEKDHVEYLKSIGYSPKADIQTVMDIHKREVLPWLHDNSKEYGKRAVEEGLHVCIYSYSVLGCRISNERDYNDYFFNISEYIRRNISAVFHEKSSVGKENGGTLCIGIVGDVDCVYNDYSIAVANLLSGSMHVKCTYFDLSHNKRSTSKICVKLENSVEYVRIDISAESITEGLKQIENAMGLYSVDILFCFLSVVWNYILYSIDISPVVLLFSARSSAKISACGCDNYATIGSPAFFKQKTGLDFWNILPFYYISYEEKSKHVRSRAKSIILYYSENHKCDHSGTVITSILENNKNVELFCAEKHVADRFVDLLSCPNQHKRAKTVAVSRLKSGIKHANIVIFGKILEDFPFVFQAMALGKPVVFIDPSTSFWTRDVRPAYDIYKMIEKHIFFKNKEINYSFFNDAVVETMRLISNSERMFFFNSLHDAKSCCEQLLNDKVYYNKYMEVQQSIYSSFYCNVDNAKRMFNRLIKSLLKKKKCREDYFDSIITSPEPNSVIAITAMSKCVNRCIFCLQSISQFNPIIRVQSRKTFEKMLAELPTRTQKISLTTFAETLEFKSEILSRTKAAIDNGVVPSFETSNIFWDEDFYIQLLQMGIGRILVSINAPTRELYKKVTQRDTFERVIENTEKMIELRNKVNPNVQIHMHIMLFKEFMNDARALMERFRNRVDYIYYQGLCNWGNSKWNEDKYKAFGVTPLKMNQRRYPCPSIFDTLVLHPDGNYYMCGMSYQHHVEGKVISMLGNSANMTVMDAWRRLSYYRIRHVKGEWSELDSCRECNGWLNWTLYLDDVIISEDGWIELKRKQE